MTFSEALELIKEGFWVRRKGWSRGMFLYLVSGSTFKVNRPPLLEMYPEGTQINYKTHIDIRCADGECVPWVASQTDILAKDWEEEIRIEDPEKPFGYTVAGGHSDNR